MDAVKTLQLTKTYGKSRGITALDLTVADGEFFGFIGPNGAGKSTTIRTLLGLIRPTSGTAAVFGKDIQKDKKAILAEVGYLPSEAVFYSGMTVREVLKLSADLRKQNCAEESKRLCDRLLLDPARQVDELSFGNRKKVGIVCALQHFPRLLLLDEPTSGLDPLMQKEFFDILHERNQNGATVFLSSHVLSEIEHHCTRAAVIRDGKLIACDRVDNLSKTKARRVTVHGDFSPNSLPDVKDISKTESSVSFLYGGDINALLSALSTCRITDLSVTEPGLEEIFMHFYTDKGGKA